MKKKRSGGLSPPLACRIFWPGRGREGKKRQNRQNVPTVTQTQCATTPAKHKKSAKKNAKKVPRKNGGIFFSCRPGGTMSPPFSSRSTCYVAS